MDTFENYFNIQMILLSLLIWVAVVAQRRIIEAIFIHFKVNIKTAKTWRNLFLPLGGPGTGIILAFLIPLSLPAGYVGWAGKLFAGLLCGLFSSKIYQILKQVLTNKLTMLTQKVETKVAVTAIKTTVVTEKEIDPDAVVEEEVDASKDATSE
jgi:hypothetical protein